MKKFTLFALGTVCALALLPACGQIQKPSLTKKSEAQVPALADPKSSEFAKAWGTDLVSGCKNHQGYLNADSSQCTVVEQLKALDGTERQGSPVDIGAISDGVGILAVGLSTSEGVVVTLDNKEVSAVPSRDNRPILPAHGGKLAFLVNPGAEYRDVRLYSYTCVGLNLNPVACRF